MYDQKMKKRKRNKHAYSSSTERMFTILGTFTKSATILRLTKPKRLT